MSIAATAHHRGLLTFWDAAKLLDLDYLQVIDEIGTGRLDAEWLTNDQGAKLPCISLAAIDAYRASRQSA